MSHPQQQEFLNKVRHEFPSFFRGKRVLEIGSLDINGSIRSMFSDCDYVGIDVAAGPGVDVVCQGQDYAAPDASFDVVISCEVMEHNPYWAETMRNMSRLCRPNGMVIMTCATLGRHEHGTTRTTPNSSPLTVDLGWDYYRNLTIADFTAEKTAKDLSHIFVLNWDHYDLYFIGFKGAVDAATLEKLNGIRREYLKAHWTSVRSLRRAAKATLLNRRYYSPGNIAGHGAASLK